MTYWRLTLFFFYDPCCFSTCLDVEHQLHSKLFAFFHYLFLCTLIFHMCDSWGFGVLNQTRHPYFWHTLKSRIANKEQDEVLIFYRPNCRGLCWKNKPQTNLSKFKKKGGIGFTHRYINVKEWYYHLSMAVEFLFLFCFLGFLKSWI